MPITSSYFSAVMVGTSTEGEGVLQPHQMAVDKQEPQHLHHLTGAMLGGVVPVGGPVVAEIVPYAVPDVGWEEPKCPVCHLRVPVLNNYFSYFRSTL